MSMIEQGHVSVRVDTEDGEHPIEHDLEVTSSSGDAGTLDRSRSRRLSRGGALGLCVR
jgi:hypothetical protein